MASGILPFKINLAIGFIQKPARMHWLGYNDAVHWLTKQKLKPFTFQGVILVLQTPIVKYICDLICKNLTHIRI